MSAQLIKRLTMRSLWPGVDVTFQGKWDEHSWRNVPGPFYGARVQAQPVPYCTG